MVYHKEWNCATVVEANLASNDNVMKNVMSLTTRVATIWSKVIPIPYLVKLMVVYIQNHVNVLKRLYMQYIIIKIRLNAQ